MKVRFRKLKRYHEVKKVKSEKCELIIYYVNMLVRKYLQLQYYIEISPTNAGCLQVIKDMKKKVINIYFSGIKW